MQYRDGKPYAQIYTPQETHDWEEHVAHWAKLQLRHIDVVGGDFTVPLRGRLLVATRFNMRKPPSYPKRVTIPTKKPDLDNLNKALLDGLVKGGIILDDARVTDQSERKRYADAEHPEGVEVELTSIPVEEP